MCGGSVGSEESGSTKVCGVNHGCIRGHKKQVPYPGHYLDACSSKEKKAVEISEEPTLNEMSSLL